MSSTSGHFQTYLRCTSGLADQVMATVDAQGTPFAQHVEAAPRGMGTFIEEEQIPNAVS